MITLLKVVFAVILPGMRLVSIDAGVHRDIFTAVHDTSIKCCSDCTASYTLLELCKLSQGEIFEPLLTRRDG